MMFLESRVTIPAILEEARILSIRQQVEWGEVFSGFEFRNRYAIEDGIPGNTLMAGEKASGFKGWISRQFLKSMRPFEIEIRDPSGQLVLSLHRPFRFFFYRTEVRGVDGEFIGSIERRFTWLRRRYVMEGVGGIELGELLGPFFKPWTFEILVGNRKEGHIRKKWSGLGKELFTKADTFGVELGVGLDARQRALCLGATFLIDFAHFERSS